MGGDGAFRIFCAHILAPRFPLRLVLGSRCTPQLFPRGLVAGDKGPKLIVVFVIANWKWMVWRLGWARRQFFVGCACEREREREREIQTERERERDRERERERESKIGDEFTLSLAKNSHNWRWAYTFPCQKFALFVSPFTLPVSPFTERSPLWRWNSQRVHTFHCQKNFRPLCSPSFKWHEPRDEWSKTQDKWSNPAQSYFVLPIEKMNQINTKNYWK